MPSTVCVVVRVNDIHEVGGPFACRWSTDSVALEGKDMACSDLWRSYDVTMMSRIDNPHHDTCL